MIEFLYALVVLLATTIGAVAGLGGGVIIKPLLDLIGRDDAATIGVYSSVAVFAMCVVSIAKQMRRGFRFDRQLLIAVSLGSVVGGVVGEQVLHGATSGLDNGIVTAVQSGLLGLTLLGILAYTLNADRLRSFEIRAVAPVFAVGAFLGSISVFLGIGGGPLNIALLTWLFPIGLKDATVYSLATIFFAQVAKLGLIATTTGFARFELPALPWMVAAAIVGGLLGTSLNLRCSGPTIRRAYVVLLVALIGVAAFNLASSLPALAG